MIIGINSLAILTDVYILQYFFKDNLLSDSPIDCCETWVSSGWITSPDILPFMKHFVKIVRGVPNQKSIQS